MPLFGLSFGPAAVTYLDGMQPGKLRAQIVKKAKSLIDEPFPPGCKKLAGVKSGADAVWRVRSGDYRILYIARSTEIVIIDINHRKDVYR